MTKYISRAAIAAAALTLGVSGANATNLATGNLSVSATVITACTVSGGTLAFGNVATNNSTTTTASSTGVSITCPVAYSVTLDQGAHWDTADAKYQVADYGGTHLIGYHLSDTSGNTTWGTPTSSGNSGPTTLTVYGTLDALTGQPAGSYTDTVQIQVNY